MGVSVGALALASGSACAISAVFLLQYQPEALFLLFHHDRLLLDRLGSRRWSDRYWKAEKHHHEEDRAGARSEK